jgi:hypothetical protein
MILWFALLDIRIVLPTRWCWLDAMSSDKMFKKGIASIENPLSWKDTSGTESTLHDFFEVAKRMPNSVIGPCEALDVVFAIANRAFFGSLRLVSE